MYSLKNSLCLFQLSGADAVDFINNQIINRFDKNTQQPHYTAICNPKGRILFSLLMWHQDNSIFLAVDVSLAAQCKQYIMMRRFRMKFDLSESAEYAVFAPDISSNQVSDLKLSKTDNGNSAKVEDFWGIFFRSELPWISIETTEQFIPQNLSLDRHQLIEYEKGCYPGQEIIARLHFIGQNKKEMVLITMDADNDYKNSQKVTINDNPVQLCSPVIRLNDRLQAQVVKNKL